MPEKSSPVESVDRALRVLELLSESGSGLTLEELAGVARIPKSSLHRILAALRHRGFAAQQEESGRYFLGTEMLRAAFGFHDRLDLRALVHPLMVHLRDELNETVHMAVLDGGDVVYVDKVESSHPIKMTSVVGGRNPAHCTAVGKALLAWTYPTEESAREWVRRFGPLRRRTKHTVTSGAALSGELARIRARGYALDLEESEPGVRCVAIPLFLGQATAAAAISVSAPRDRLSEVRRRRVIASLRHLADDALVGHGDRPAPPPPA